MTRSFRLFKFFILKCSRIPQVSVLGDEANFKSKRFPLEKEENPSFCAWRGFILFLLLTTGFLVRLYKINSPIADWHSWRQTDTSAVARNFIKHGYNLLIPKFDDLSSLPSGKENPNGYRFVEFPVFNAIHAGFYQVLEGLGVLKKLQWNFETIGRLTSAVCSLAAAVTLFSIVKLFWGWFPGILTMGFYLFLPFNIYYSRTVLPDQTMIAITLASVYFFLKLKFQNLNLKTKSQNLKLFTSIFLAALSILVKPYAIFILLPTWLVVFGGEYLKLKNRGDRKKYFLFFVFYILVCFFPFLLWRLWMLRFSEGIPASGWLFNFSNIRLRPAWWRWLFFERIGKLILGGWGLILLGLGIISRLNNLKREAVFYGWLAGMFAYLVVFAGGNVTHDYYQVILVPVLAVFLTKGFLVLISPTLNHFFPTVISSINKFYKYPAFLLAIFSALAMIGFSWYQIKEYYKINHPEIIEAGKFIQENTPTDAKVVADYNGDTAFLYQTDRKGWPLKNHILYDLLKMEAKYYLSVNLANIDGEVKGKCDVIKKADNWIVYDLNTCR